LGVMASSEVGDEPCGEGSVGSGEGSGGGTEEVWEVDEDREGGKGEGIEGGRRGVRGILSGGRGDLDEGEWGS
jgi:hypothetical protein